MSEKEFTYSTSFKLFVDGIDCHCTVRDGGDANIHFEHVGAVKKLLAEFQAMGATATQSGEKLAEDEQEMECMQYVVCQYAENLGIKLCSHKYSWTVVFEEKWGDLWFEPDTSDVFPTTGFKLESLDKKYIKKVDPRMVIRKWTGKEKEIDGRMQKLYKFERVAGGNTGPPPAAEPENLNVEEIRSRILNISEDGYDKIVAANDYLLKIQPRLDEQDYKDMCMLLETKAMAQYAHLATEISSLTIDNSDRMHIIEKHIETVSKVFDAAKVKLLKSGFADKKKELTALIS